MALDHPLLIMDRNSQFYPDLLIKRLSKDASDRLWTIGRLDLISIPKTGGLRKKQPREWHSLPFS